MSNLVEFLVKVKDLASGPLAKIANAGQNGFAKMEGAVNKVTGKLGTLRSNLQQIDARMSALQKTRAISFDTRQISRINKELADLQRRKDRLEGNSARGGIGSLLRTGLAVAGIGSLAMVGTSILKTGMERQMNQVAYQVLAGNKAGNLLYGQELKFAKDTIYGNEAFAEGKLMLGSGVAAKNVMPVQNMIGDIAMGDVERMKSLTLAFSEASSTGHLTGRQELMFRTALFNPLTQLSAMTHKSVASLEKDMAKGKISINDLVKSMEYATGPMGRWHDMMERMRHTPAGEWHAFTGTLTTLAGTIGMEVLPPLGKLLSVLNDLLSNDGQMRNIAWAIGAMTVAWGLYAIAANEAAITAGLAEVAAAWPLAIVGGVVYALSQISDYTDKVTGSNNELKKSMKDTADDTGMHFNAVSGWWQSFVVTVQWGWLSIKNIWESLSQVGNDLIDGRFKDAWRDLTHPDTEASRTWQRISDHFGWTVGGYNVPTDTTATTSKGGKHARKDYIGAWEAADPDKATVPGKFDPKATGVGGGGDAPDGTTNSSITGGGVRNMTINVAKFQDKTEIHTASFKESVAEAEEMLENMFLRIVNSAAIALN